MPVSKILVSKDDSMLVIVFSGKSLINRLFAIMTKHLESIAPCRDVEKTVVQDQDLKLPEPESLISQSIEDNNYQRKILILLSITLIITNLATAGLVIYLGVKLVSQAMPHPI